MSSHRLFPDLEPHACGHLSVGGGHEVYWERVGHPSGRPLLWLHGGPGSGASPRQRRFFDPARWCVTLFDQRGCGRSTVRPDLGGGEAGASMDGQAHASRRVLHNRTPDLLADIESLRRAAGVTRWVVAGGSWGSTLALAYAARCPQAVQGLALRSPFLASRGEVRDLLSAPPAGVHAVVQAAWDRLAAALAMGDDLGPRAADRDLAQAHAVFRQGGEACRGLAVAWSVNEWARSATPATLQQALDQGFLTAPVEWARRLGDADDLWRRALVQTHYLVHGCFVDMSAVLADLSGGFAGPVVLVRGALDALCPPGNADVIAQALRAGTARIWTVPGAGHDALDDGMVAAWHDALNALAHDLDLTEACA